MRRLIAHLYSRSRLHSLAAHLPSAAANALTLLAVSALLVSCSADGFDNESYSDGGNYHPQQDMYSGGDTWVPPGQDASSDTGGNTNINLGGAQDFGYFRRLLQDNIIPQPDDIDAAGFFAEHHTPLPEPICGDRVCLQAMLGVMSNLINGNNCTLLQIGLNSPLVADEMNRPPLQLAVVVDTSGSMRADGKMEYVKQGLERMILELNDDDQMAIITYDQYATTRMPLTTLAGNRNQMLDVVRGINPDGATNIYDGLEAGYAEIFENYDPARQNRVILLSDGQATTGITGDEDIIGMSSTYNSDGIGLTTVGLGTDFNYTLMRSLSEQSDGNFYYLEDASAVDEVFTQEINYFTVPVAFDVSIEVEEGAHYQFRQAYGSNLWEDTETGGRLLVPSVFLAHRTSSEDVEPGNERRGGGSALLLELMPRDDVDPAVMESDVATIHFSFRDPETNQVVEDTIEIRYPYSPDTLLLEGFFDNDIVTKSFVVLNILVALQDATSLAHSNRPEEAIALLRRVIAAAADYEDSANDGMGDTDIVLDIELMEQLIDVIVANGTPEPEEIDVPDDPWPRE